MQSAWCCLPFNWNAPWGVGARGEAKSALCWVAEPLKRDDGSHLTALYASAIATPPTLPPTYLIVHLQLWLTACHIFHRTCSAAQSSLASLPQPYVQWGMLISSLAAVVASRCQSCRRFYVRKCGAMKNSSNKLSRPSHYLSICLSLKSKPLFIMPSAACGHNQHDIKLCFHKNAQMVFQLKMHKT